MRMNGPSWSTSALSRGEGTEAAELAPLGEHLQRCRCVAGRHFALRCGAEAVQGFVAARLISTVLVVLALLVGGVWLLL
ncbi:hypothetical protein [Aquabacterium sp. OR-4]|uniref:hypothetical protein n=1 Tax=Aquabacterium sp. OR-4 TaxID=2978127 RepID=UPI0021B412B2|nr:hypothetical protein [Aquabacterium sp. OR-4]MDT7834112.1 hypothetical protein [Aquabacterium sp. OR-4]